MGNTPSGSANEGGRSRPPVPATPATPAAPAAWDGPPVYAEAVPVEATPAAPPLSPEALSPSATAAPPLAHIVAGLRLELGLSGSHVQVVDQAVAELGLPAATEALDPTTPQYMQDLISWSAIGARTTESQTHREMSSGLSGPVGFKNGTDGSLDVAVNAMLSVKHPHRFLGIDPDGRVALTTTKGNPYAHVVLRGGGGKPNYDSVSVALAESALEKAGVSTNIMVDCSHANSNKDPNLQPLVMENIGNQILEGNKSIVGLMVESHLKGGNQKLPANLDDLEYGVSVTDGCIAWDTTEQSIRDLADKVRDTLPRRNQ